MAEGNDQLRISAAERQDAVAALSKQFSDGRLTADEFSTRCAAVAAAVTRSDLAPVFADLPVNLDTFIRPQMVNEAVLHQRAHFDAQRASQERRRQLGSLFRHLRTIAGIAAFCCLVLGFYSLFYGSQSFGWVAATAVLACASLLSAALSSRLQKR